MYSTWEHSLCVCVCVCVCVGGCVHSSAFIMTIHPNFICSCCSQFKAEKARKLIVAVGSFLSLITLTTDTMDMFGWLLCIVIIQCTYSHTTPAHSICMHAHLLAVFGALDVVNVASDNYRVKSACNQNGMSQWNLPCTPNLITVRRLLMISPIV